MMIPSSPSAAPSPASASSGKAAGAASATAPSSGFAAILGDAAAPETGAVAVVSADAAAEKTAPAKAAATATPGKTPGKALPDIAAAALNPEIRIAQGDSDETTDTSPETDADADAGQASDTTDATSLDAADTLMAVLAVLAPVAPVVAEKNAPAVSAQPTPAAMPTAVVSAPKAASTRTALAVLAQLPAADAGNVGNAIATPATPTSPQPTQVAASVEQVRLASIEVSPAAGSKAEPASTAPAPIPVAAVLDAQPKATPATPGTPPAAAAPAQPAQPAPSPLTTDPAAPARAAATVVPAQVAASDNSTAPAERQPELPALTRAATLETSQTLTLPQQTVQAAAPPASVGNSATPQDVPQGPQDFATLVSRIAEAREAAGTQVVRTAFNHAQFGSVSLQFRPEGSGLSVTMASADPSFNTAVHAGVAASLAGQMSGDQGDPARSDGRQGWQPSGSNGAAQTGNGNFSQDQRQASAQTGTAAGGQDGERRHAQAARGDSPATVHEDRPARSTRADRGGIYA